MHTATAQQKPTLNVMVQQSDFMDPSDIETIGKILRSLGEKYIIREHCFDPVWGFPADWEKYHFFIIKTKKGVYLPFTAQKAHELFGARDRSQYSTYSAGGHKHEGDIFLC